MNILTQPLHDEHAELFPQVERILEVGTKVDGSWSPELSHGLEEVHSFLADHLLAHAKAEEAALYPAVQRALGSPEATRTMSRDHVEITGYVEELGSLLASLHQPALTTAQAAALRRVLYGVYALLRLHFAKEEEVYLPILDRSLTPDAARAMFEKMEEIAANARQSLEA